MNGSRADLPERANFNAAQRDPLPLPDASFTVRRIIGNLVRRKGDGREQEKESDEGLGKQSAHWGTHPVWAIHIMQVQSLEVWGNYAFAQKPSQEK